MALLYADIMRALVVAKPAEGYQGDVESMLQQDMVVRTKQGAGKKIKQTAMLNIEGGRLGNSSGEQRNALVPEGQVDMGGGQGPKEKK